MRPGDLIFLHSVIYQFYLHLAFRGKSVPSSPSEAASHLRLPEMQTEETEPVGERPSGTYWTLSATEAFIFFS